MRALDSCEFCDTPRMVSKIDKCIFNKLAEGQLLKMVRLNQ